MYFICLNVGIGVGGALDSHAVLACDEASFSEPDERHVSRVALAFGASATLYRMSTAESRSHS